MSFKILTLKDKEEWNKYLALLPVEQQDVYYTPEYYQLYEENGDGKANCFLFEKDGKIALYPYLINSVNKLGYLFDEEYFDTQGAYGYNGVVASSYDEKFIEDFYLEFDKYCREKNIIAEFTRFHPLINNYIFSKNNLNIITDRITVYIDLSQEYEEIWLKQYSSKNRNKIRKGRKCYSLEIGRSGVDLVEFKKMYYNTMNKVCAEDYYYFNEDYFQNIIDNNCFLLYAVDKDTKKTEAGLLLLKYSNYSHYHLSGRSLECKNNSVTNFLIDEAVKLSIHEKSHFLHLGGGATTSNEDSLLSFKKSFSKNESFFKIGTRIHNEAIYNKVCSVWENEYKKEDNIKLLRYREV
jgi:hypothetical protein